MLCSDPCSETPQKTMVREFKPLTFATSAPHFSRVGFGAMGVLFVFTLFSVFAMHSFWLVDDADGNAIKQQQRLIPKPPSRSITTRHRSKSKSIPFVPFANNTVAYNFNNNHLETLTLHHATNNKPIKRNSGLHLITTFFRGSYSLERLQEILGSLVSNLENPHIAALHVMWEDVNPKDYLPLIVQRSIANFNHKLILRKVKHQPTYEEMFIYANTELQRGAIAMVANADLYFDSSVRCINTTARKGDGENMQPRMAFALSRRHSPLCGNKTEHFHLFDLCVEVSAHIGEYRNRKANS